MTKKILIVDDSKTILKLNTRIITALMPDAEILAFDIPQLALDGLQVCNFKLDFAFLDYNMAGMNGVELAQTLVGINPSPIAYSNICIVSANIQEAVTSRVKNLGMEFVAKPFNEQKLKAFLEQRGIKLG